MPAKEDEKKIAANLWAECVNVVKPTTSLASINENCPEEVQKEGGCSKYQEEFLARKYPSLFCRMGDSLVLKLSNGEFEAFKNNTDDSHVETFTLYSFDKYFPEVRYGLLYEGFYEGGTYELVSFDTGTKTDVGGDVILSPDKKRFAAHFSDLEAGFSPNVLAVYLITPTGLIEEFRGQPEEWGPEDIKWIDSQTIEFNKTTYSDTDFSKEKHHLQFLGGDSTKQGNWEIDGRLRIEKERMQIKLSDIEELVSPNAAIVSVTSTSTGAQVTGYGLSDIDVLLLSSSLSSHYLPIRIRVSAPSHEAYCGKTFSRVIIDIEGDSSTLESKSHVRFTPVLIKTKDGKNIECALP